MQDFVYYLTYRSGVNPKKLAFQFECFVTPLSEGFLFDRTHYHAPTGPLLPTTDFMLQFPPEGQYEIQLISQIFILFHGDLSASIRKYGDKLAVATFSILDYLLKFHSPGFNSRDVERMLDFLDIHRAPALPQLTRLLLERLLAPYLRPVDNGIYEYRFLLHFQREMVYISQFSEQELAALNFTLDESIAIKQHFHDFRDEQLRLSRGLAPILWPKSVHPLPGARRGGLLALPFIDVILGDLHSLDREYDQAQTEYRNALDGIEPALAAIVADHAPGSDNDGSAVAASRSVPAFSHFLLYLRTLLKSSLIYEQRRQYDQAAAGYLQAKSLVESALEHPSLVRLFSRAENRSTCMPSPTSAWPSSMPSRMPPWSGHSNIWMMRTQCAGDWMCRTNLQVRTTAASKGSSMSACICARPSSCCSAPTWWAPPVALPRPRAVPTRLPVGLRRPQGFRTAIANP